MFGRTSVTAGSFPCSARVGFVLGCWYVQFYVRSQVAGTTSSVPNKHQYSSCAVVCLCPFQHAAVSIQYSAFNVQQLFVAYSHRYYTEGNQSTSDYCCLILRLCLSCCLFYLPIARFLHGHQHRCHVMPTKRRAMDYAHHVIGAVYGTYLLFHQGTICRPTCPAPNLYVYAQTNEFRYVQSSTLDAALVKCGCACTVW